MCKKGALVFNARTLRGSPFLLYALSNVCEFLLVIKSNILSFPNLWAGYATAVNNSSSMKITKSKVRAQLTDDHVQDIMLLDSSTLPSELQKLSNKIQHQRSHLFCCNCTMCRILCFRYEL